MVHESNLITVWQNLKANVSDVKSLNATFLNSTSSLQNASSMVEREIDIDELLQLLDEESNSTNTHSANCSCECEMVKPVNTEVKRATVEVMGNETLRFNATEGQAAVNNQTIRQVSVNGTSNVKAADNSTKSLNGSEGSFKVRDVDVQLKVVSSFLLFICNSRDLTCLPFNRMWLPTSRMLNWFHRTRHRIFRLSRLPHWLRSAKLRRMNCCWRKRATLQSRVIHPSRNNLVILKLSAQ